MEQEFNTFQERTHRRPNYCKICNRQLSDANAFKSHVANNAHKSKLASYTLNPTPIIMAYSNRFSSDMLDLIQSIIKTKDKNSSVRLEEVYKEYTKAGRRGGIVYIEATRWENLDAFGKWFHESGLGEWEEGTGVVRCNKGIDEVIKAEPNINLIKKKRRIDREGEMKTKSSEKKLMTPLIKQEVTKAIPRKLLVNPLFQEVKQVENGKDTMKPLIKKSLKYKQEDSTGIEYVADTVIKEIPDESPIVVAEEMPWIKPGLLVTLTGLQETYPSLNNSRVLITAVQDSFGAYVKSVSTPSAPLLLVDQDNCVPFINLEDLSPFGSTEQHLIIKGNEDEIGRMVRIIRRIDKNTVECVDEQSNKLVISTNSLCLIHKHT